MLNRTLTPHSMINGNACFAYFNKIWGIPAKNYPLQYKADPIPAWRYRAGARQLTVASHRSFSSKVMLAEG